MSQLSASIPAFERADATRASDAACCIPFDPQVPWLRLAIGIFVAAQSMGLGLALNITPPEDRSTRLLLQGALGAATLVVAVLLGWPLLRAAVAELRKGRATIELLFLSGITAAFALSIHAVWIGTGAVYFEVVAVLLAVHSAGRAVSGLARQRALRAIDTFDREAQTARVVTDDAVEMRPVRSVGVGERVRIMPGEIIAVDGVVLSGQSLVCGSSFTGQWFSRVVTSGDVVRAGETCEDGSLDLRATASGCARDLDELLTLLRKSSTGSSVLLRQADRFVQWFLPAVAVTAAGTFCYWLLREGGAVAVLNALSVVLVACPCAAGLAAPIALWSCVRRLAAAGLHVTDGDVIERLASVRRVVFDKTGTLSARAMTLVSMESPLAGEEREVLVAQIAAIERHSNHPVARALHDIGLPDSNVMVRALRLLPGRGIEADLGDSTVRITRQSSRELEMCLLVERDDKPVAVLNLRETVRENAGPTVAALRDLGLDVEVMTGDSPAGADSVRQLAPTTDSMTPKQKFEHVVERAAESKVLFVGDGVNDAPAMRASHVAIAMAGGEPVAAGCASAVLHGGDLGAISRAIIEARGTVRAIRAGIAIAVAYNLIGMTLAATGRLHPVVAAILMSVSSLLVSHRAARAPVHTAEAPRHGAAQVWHWLGLVGQIVLLCLIAGVGLPALVCVSVLAAILALLVVGRLNRLPSWLDHVVAMTTLGGLGMNLGWWIDAGLAPAVRDGVVIACCGIGHPFWADSFWMYVGMLALGVPAMYLLRRGAESFSLRKWCCTGSLAIGVPLMCAGMWLGGVFAARLTIDDPQLRIVAMYLAMMIGMNVGMMLPHLAFKSPAQLNK